MTEPSSAALASIAPVVLVGGRSVRFGRDKLLVDLGGRPMVAAPIAALREVFGPRVTAIGPCDPAVRALADAWLPDDHPGSGPMGGILTALERFRGPVLVLAGDLPAIDAATVRALVDAFLAIPEAAVALATAADDGGLRDHPCAAVYGRPMRAILAAARHAGRFGLRDAIAGVPASGVIRVGCPPARLANVNRPADLPLTSSAPNAAARAASGASPA